MSAMAIETINLLGGNAEAAKFYGVTLGAISQWKASGLPPGRELELFKRRPDIFAAATRAASERIKEAA